MIAKLRIKSYIFLSFHRYKDKLTLIERGGVHRGVGKDGEDVRRDSIVIFATINIK